MSSHRTDSAQEPALTELGRYAGPATLILASLADGAKHGYALTKDIESFSGVRLPPGTLYEALARLQAQGLIAPVESNDRRRPYRLTAAGAQALRVHLDAQRKVADLGLRRLAGHWGLA
ncbi:MAG: PadR family transcriptional regulator [Streptosporangiaceae bacterium]